VRLLLALAAAVPLAILAACGSEGEGGEAEFTLTEFEITADKASLPEGPIDFNINNDGEREHEFVIVRTDIPGDELPTGDDGSFDEDAPGVDVEQEIEDIGGGDETSRSYTLDPGAYVFLCNIVEDIDGTETSHFANGMFLDFQVTEDS